MNHKAVPIFHINVKNERRFHAEIDATSNWETAESSVKRVFMAIIMYLGFSLYAAVREHKRSIAVGSPLFHLYTPILSMRLSLDKVTQSQVVSH